MALEPIPTTRIRRLAAVLALSALTSVGVSAASLNLTLSGADEVPAVNTAAKGSGTITVSDNGAVSGSVSTTGVAGTVAHIHEGAPGKSGPVVVALTKDGDSYKVPAGAKISDAQFASFKAGNLYVNVHSAANPKGELRAQLK